MGFGTFLGDLDVFKAACFSIIENRIAEMRDEDMKKASLKAKSSARRR